MKDRLHSRHNIPEQIYGLIGYPLSHSWSGRYFAEKFRREGIRNCSYALFPLKSLEELSKLLQDTPHLRGFNVTIPYKERILPYLNSQDETAEAIGAVNTVVVKQTENSGLLLKGYNTDAGGFEESLIQAAVKIPEKALILGSGGAARAVTYVLQKYGCETTLVSRKPASEAAIAWEDLDSKLMASCGMIINTTPLGMHPETSGLPPIPYQYLNSDHILYDLVYNPPFTRFLSEGQARGCAIIGGESMLTLQAEKAWEIWQKENS